MFHPTRQAFRSDPDLFRCSVPLCFRPVPSIPFCLAPVPFRPFRSVLIRPVVPLWLRFVPSIPFRLDPVPFRAFLSALVPPLCPFHTALFLDPFRPFRSALIPTFPLRPVPAYNGASRSDAKADSHSGKSIHVLKFSACAQLYTSLGTCGTYELKSLFPSDCFQVHLTEWAWTLAERSELRLLVDRRFPVADLEDYAESMERMTRVRTTGIGTTVYRLFSGSHAFLPSSLVKCWFGIR